MEMIVVYGLLVCACVGLAWRSGNLVVQQIAALVALDWAVGNLTFQYAGAYDPWLAPSLGAIVAVLIGRLAIAHHSRIAWIAVLTFIAQETVAVVGFATHTQGSERYYLLLNVAFTLRVMIVGGVAGYVVANRPAARNRSPARGHAHRSRNL